MTPLQTDIERRLAQSEPDVEVLLAEILGGRCLRVFIDHPEGVTLALCERVTTLLSDERERYSLEDLLPRQRASAEQAGSLPSLRRSPRTRANASSARGRTVRERPPGPQLHRRARGSL